jgi:IPT/TIG domain
VVTNVSPHTGSAAGGTELTITGHNFFMGDDRDDALHNLVVTIDGVPCKINSKTLSNTQIVCYTGPNLNPTTKSYYVGGHGLRRDFFTLTSSTLSYTSLLAATPPDWTQILTSFELPRNTFNGPSGNLIRGYFKAPVTANYTFFISCDDACKLLLSASPDPAQKN